MDLHPDIRRYLDTIDEAVDTLRNNYEANTEIRNVYWKCGKDSNNQARIATLIASHLSKLFSLCGEDLMTKPNRELGLDKYFHIRLIRAKIYFDWFEEDELSNSLSFFTSQLCELEGKLEEINENLINPPKYTVDNVADLATRNYMKNHYPSGLDGVYVVSHYGIPKKGEMYLITSNVSATTRPTVQKAVSVERVYPIMVELVTTEKTLNENTEEGNTPMTNTIEVDSGYTGTIEVIDGMKVSDITPDIAIQKIESLTKTLNSRKALASASTKYVKKEIESITESIKALEAILDQ